MSKLSIPNHTQVPNIIIDELMGKLTGSELKVLLAICRKTIGWHKRTDAISLSQLETITGLSRKSITVAIPELEDKRLISVNRTGRINKYDLNYDSEVFTPEVVEKSHHTSEESSPPASEDTSHTKETVTKETITKSGARAELFDKAEQCDSIQALNRVWQEWRRVNGKTQGSKKAMASRMKEWGLKQSRKIVIVALSEGWNSLKEEYSNKSAEHEAFDPTGRANASAYTEYEDDFSPTIV